MAKEVLLYLRIFRANRRSSWDTMHPGRNWAADTEKDQMSRNDIVGKIAEHFGKHPPIVDKDALLRHLALGRGTGNRD